ncbi:hypothetical protein A8B78_19315 [Jannaschia sp. EhC01]|nr:hypothetical protein A8B78_19315 [Jannaschia sp. EhC01]
MPTIKALFRLSLPALLLSALPAFACPINMAVDIEWNGGQFEGVILDGPDPQGNCLVSYDGWDASWNEWVDIGRLAPLASAVPVVAPTCPVGASREIEWNGSLWDGTILEGPNAAGECYVTYEGWDASWNEWVAQERIAPVEVVATECPVGIPLEIQWNNSWWSGVVLEGPNAQGQCFVTYEGWDASWNEWVTVDRLRATQ